MKRRRKPVGLYAQGLAKNPGMKVEARQSKLAANTEATERWQRRLFRAANELQKLAKERKRLLSPPKGKLVYKGEHPTGIGGGAIELNDSLDGI
jgi:hypothetical protein